MKKLKGSIVPFLLVVIGSASWSGCASDTTMSVSVTGYVYTAQVPEANQAVDFCWHVDFKENSSAEDCDATVTDQGGIFHSEIIAPIRILGTADSPQDEVLGYRVTLRVHGRLYRGQFRPLNPLDFANYDQDRHAMVGTGEAVFELSPENLVSSLP